MGEGLKFNGKEPDTTRVEVFGWVFVRNAANAANFCKKFGDCGECGEKKIFHRISYKKSLHRLLWQIIVRNVVNVVYAAFHRISYKNSPQLFSNVYLNPQEIS